MGRTPCADVEGRSRKEKARKQVFTREARIHMTLALFWMLCALCLAIICWSVLTRDGIYRTPFLMAATVSGFILPQIVGLLDQPLPEGALDMFLIMAVLSIVCSLIGDRLPSTSLSLWNWDLDERKLLWSAGGLTIVGGAFQIALGDATEGEFSAADLAVSGLPVALLFFARVLPYGLAISVFLYVKHRSRTAMWLAVVGLVFEIERIVMQGRRANLFEVAFIILLPCWFAKGWMIPRGLMLAGIVMAALIVPSAGVYRRLISSDEGPDWAAVKDISLLDNMREDVLDEGGSEVRSASFALLATEITGEYDYGINHWNGLVYNYVPAQLVGADLKNALMFETKEAVEEEALGFQKLKGSTYTGFTGVFKSFWYLGCLEFMAMSFVLARLYKTALKGRFVAQVVYSISLVPVMHTVTHHTQRLLSFWIHVALFLLPCLFLARKRSKRESSHESMKALSGSDS